MKKGFVSYIMKFLDLFRTDNKVDERNIVGFWAMILLTLVILVEVSLNAFGRVYEVNPNIYEVLLWTVLGSFGISTVSNGIARGVNSFTKRRTSETFEEDPQEGERRVLENLENLDEYKNER